MGATVQWRGEQDKEPARYGKTITFGNLRDKGTGYMAYSERVGPGIIVLGGSQALCDRLMDEGFTALAPDIALDDSDKIERLLVAATEFLVDNWHPRIGVLAVGDTQNWSETLSARKPLDAVTLVDDENDVDDEVIDDFRYDLS